MILGIPGVLAAQQRVDDGQKKKEEEEEVSPAEDLMREHGVLKRALLVYSECANRLESGKEVPPTTVTATANPIRKFIEEYHEKLEEEYLFPRFRKAGKLVDLVGVLEAQHKAGRRVTEQILTTAKASGFLRDEPAKKKLTAQIRAFIRMYEPHEAREDTVLFPAFREIVPKNEYDSLGEDFEKREHRLFGEEGFHKIVEEVAGLEKTIGIYDLGQFTPRG
ncbi:MAG: hemerythrin domain-containing protein [Bryobacteraceae bacterium]|nr:hemerythrin domain-containing protein [Bryobacteraceae bacterium]